jgi:hypothetical protein
MKGGLVSRIEKLEQKLLGGTPPVFHSFIHEENETREQAQARYEAESGRKIGPDDCVIVRVIVSPKWGMQ